MRDFAVHIGSPRVPLAGGLYYGNQHYYLKQIVPNSRLIVVPPKGDGVHWQSRLYLTPSQVCLSKEKSQHFSSLVRHNCSFVMNHFQP